MIRKQSRLLAAISDKRKPEDKFEYEGQEAIAQVSLIENKRVALLKALEDGSPAATVTMDLTNIILQALVNLIPSLERAANQNPRGVYALDKVVNNIRELSHDLRSMEDRNAMRDKIMNGIIDPALLNFANTNVTELNRLGRLVKDDAEASDFVESLKARVSTLVNTIHVNVSNSLDVYFGGSKDATTIISEAAVDESRNYFDAPDDREIEYKNKIARTRKSK